MPKPQNPLALAAPPRPIDHGDHLDFIEVECDQLQKLLGMQAVSCRALAGSDEAADAIGREDLSLAFEGMDALLESMRFRIGAISDAAEQLRKSSSSKAGVR